MPQKMSPTTAKFLTFKIFIFLFIKWQNRKNSINDSLQKVLRLVSEFQIRA
jgi:hypothetical protein